MTTSIQTNATDAIFEDLMSRFILNVPENELKSTERICFQIEQSHWYYEDFYCDVCNPTSNSGVLNPHKGVIQNPHFTLKQFTAEMFNRCPTLRQDGNLEEIFQRFLTYKSSIPVCGAVLLNINLDKILLVKSWNGKAWSMPKGKINKDESFVNCCIREVEEETGFLLEGNDWENNYMEFMFGEQLARFYIIPGVPENFDFKPKTRKEISDVQWHLIGSLPGISNSENVSNKNKYFIDKRLIRELSKWLSKNRKRVRKSLNSQKNQILLEQHSEDLLRMLKGNDSASTSMQSTPDQLGKSLPTASMEVNSVPSTILNKNNFLKSMSWSSPPTNPTVLGPAFLKSGSLTFMQDSTVSKLSPPSSMSNKTKKPYPDANELLSILRDANKSPHQLITQSYPPSINKGSSSSKQDLLRILRGDL